MQEEKAQQYTFEEERAYLSSMDSGKDDGDTLQPSEVGEVAVVEIGDPNHGVFSEFDRIALGGIPDDQLRTRAARVEADLQNGSDADPPNGTTVRLRITDKRRNQTYAKTGWMAKSELEASSVENLPVLAFEGFGEAVFGKDGRVIVLEARNASTAFNVDTSNSTFDFPIVGAY